MQAKVIFMRKINHSFLDNPEMWDILRNEKGDTEERFETAEKAQAYLTEEGFKKFNSFPSTGSRNAYEVWMDSAESQEKDMAILEWVPDESSDTTPI